MYLPEHFTENREEEVNHIVDGYPLATLIGYSSGDFIVNHIPLIRKGDKQLIGHIAKGNDIISSFKDGQNVLAIFSGEEGYVSPNWCPSKQLTHMVVPTWNYQVVHVHGSIGFLKDDASKRFIVNRMTTIFETKTEGEQAWKMADAPNEFLKEKLDQIVGIQIDVDKIVSKSKLSQNRTPADFQGISAGLQEVGEVGLADAMSRLSKD